ncbi:MAG TPA: hypothetical protein VN877_00290 [Opitutaceae bacterium]|nr:hypothetical protein [Opitutaceae bacterium]
MAFLLAASGLGADPLSKKAEIDFYADVQSRDLHGLATRSDGRLVGGPVLADLRGQAPCDLLWCLEPAPGGKWIAGGGPGGRIVEVSADLAAGTYSARDILRLGEPQVYALRPLPDGSILAGTSPAGGLYLVRDGKIAARTGLPAGSIFDILLLDKGGSALVATGDPGRIYRIDLAKFAAAGVSAGRTDDANALAARGVSLFGEVGDTNLRRIARLSDGRIAAGSAPRGNIYLFAPDGGSPYIAQENHDAEVTDLLADPSGGYFAAIVYSGGDIHPAMAGFQAVSAAEPVLTVVGGAPGPTPAPTPTPAPGGAVPKPREAPAEALIVPAQVERFAGRSTLQWFSTDGFPETLTARAGVAFYRIGRLGDVLVISGGEQGEMSGFDLSSRLSLTFAGSASSQVNALEPVPGAPGKFLAVRNNAPGFSVLDFNGSLARTAQTKRVDLGVPARLGALRFNRTRELDPAQLAISIRTSNASGETDGWSPWTAMAYDDGWRAQVPVGRYAELKLSLSAGSRATLELDKASLYFLSQNHRPQLEDFRMLSPNFAIVVPPEAPAPVVTTVGQLIQGADREADRKRNGFLGSQVVASTGTRVAFWTVIDPDGDNLVYTFSIRRDGDPSWTDLAIDSADSYVQFDTLHLQEGTWFTRLVARQAAPRPEGERLSVTFETDDMVVDHTPPQIEEASVRREPGKVLVTVRGRDALSILDSAEFDFNNGVHETVEQPADGILDGMRETFVLEIPSDRAAGATSVEVTLYDAAGNGATRRLGL